ncbi:MAG: F0F1 ATP synthase subunit B [Clostridia bacterium]|nr:F0F1 ATP synthase subunit B [Clostridia bacterium]
MQTLDIISVNLWQILISLANLLILFLLFKKFLYKPVNNMLQKRREEIDGEYTAAQDANAAAQSAKAELEDRLANAKAEAEGIVKEAADAASIRGDKIIADAKAQAEGIIKQAESAAELTAKRAQDDIKTQIVDISTAISEKMLEREINADDHKALIDSVIFKIGDDNDSNI